MNKITGTILVVALLAGTNAATYWLTREKWHDLGRENGAIAGRADVLNELCALATDGRPAEAEPALELTLKADLVELIPAPEGYSIHCR